MVSVQNSAQGRVRKLFRPEKGPIFFGGNCLAFRKSRRQFRGPAGGESTGRWECCWPWSCQRPDRAPGWETPQFLGAFYKSADGYLVFDRKVAVRLNALLAHLRQCSHCASSWFRLPSILREAITRSAPPSRMARKRGRSTTSSFPSGEKKMYASVSTRSTAERKALPRPGLTCLIISTPRFSKYSSLPSIEPPSMAQTRSNRRVRFPCSKYQAVVFLDPSLRLLARREGVKSSLTKRDSEMGKANRGDFSKKQNSNQKV